MPSHRQDRSARQKAQPLRRGNGHPRSCLPGLLDGSSFDFAWWRFRSGGRPSRRSLGHSHQMIAVRESLRVVARSWPRTEALDWFTRQDAPRSMRQVCRRATSRTRLGRRHESGMTTRRLARHRIDGAIAPAEGTATGRTGAPGRRPNHCVEVTATSVRVCLASWIGAALTSRGGAFGQVAVPHAGRSAEMK